MGAAPDQDLWEFAIENDAVLVTKDQDFVNPRPPGELAPAVVWVRVGNTSRAALLTWFEPLIDELVGTIEAGERLVELRET